MSIPDQPTRHIPLFERGTFVHLRLRPASLTDLQSPETLEYIEHLAKWRQKLPENVSIELEPQCSVPPPSLAVPRRANATFVILARNSEVMGVVESIKQNEDRFNRKFGYPYVFLNDEPFSDEFIR